MRISDLISAFQRFADVQDGRAGATVADRAPRRGGSPGQEGPRGAEGGTQDRVVLSPEAVFRFAASQYDPRQLRQADVHALADILHDGGAIDDRDHAILTAPPPRSAGGTRPDRNLIEEFQGRLSLGIGRGEIPAVEESTRALAVLGRLASIRTELLEAEAG